MDVAAADETRASPAATERRKDPRYGSFDRLGVTEWLTDHPHGEAGLSDAEHTWVISVEAREGGIGLFVRFRSMYLAYMDESGDPGPNSAIPTYTVGIAFIHASRWVDEFEAMLDFRRYLRRTYGLKLRTEVKGSQLAKGTGPWTALGLPERSRKTIYRSYMRLQDRRAAIKTCAIVIDKSDPRADTTDKARERAWRYALQRVETFARTNGETVMLVPDAGQIFWFRNLARQMRRISFVGSAFAPGVTLRRDLLRILVDDPVERDSAESLFIQIADLNAYAAYRNRRPDPKFPASMWNELGGAILKEANRLQMQRHGGTWGIVDGP